MPATSKKQRRAAAIAEHHPEQLHKRNRSLLGLTKGQLHHFATTKESKLPRRAKKR